jgi:membrane protein
MTDYPPHILESGGAEITTKAGGARRYRKSLRNLRFRDLRALFEESASEWSKHNAPRLGAALSFYTLLSLAPLLLVLVSVVSLVLGPDAAVKGVIEQIQALAGVEAARAARLLMLSPRNTAHGILATAFGVITLLFGASAVMVELRDALNTIWDAQQPQLIGLKKISGFLKERLFSFALVFAVGFLLLVSLAISAWIAAVGAYYAAFLPVSEALLHLVNLVVSFFVVTALFAAIYKFVPDVRIQWEEVILGGAVTSALFSVGKLALGIYLGKASFASAYGAAASIVVLIVWVYYSAQIFFLGAELTKAFANRYGSRPSHHPNGMVVPAKTNTPPQPPRAPGASEKDPANPTCEEPGRQG